MRIILMMIVACLVAGGAGYYWLQNNGQAAAPVVAEAPPPPAPKVAEISLGRDLAPGAIVKAEDLSSIEIDEGAVTPAMVLATEEGETSVIGSVARDALPKGTPILRGSVVPPGDRGFLAAVLPKGQRAISIPITEVAGLSGLVMPGDRVDIILTYSVTSDAADLGRDIRASETVLTNIRVLALDRRVNQSGEDPVAPVEGVVESPVARTATLQVTPRQAETVTLATSLGDLSLVLNSVHDGGDFADGDRSPDAGPMPHESERTLTLDSDVTSLLRPKPKADEDAGQALQTIADQMRRIQIVRGSNAGAVELGQDVEPAGTPQVAAAAGAPPAEDAPAQ